MSALTYTKALFPFRFKILQSCTKWTEFEEASNRTSVDCLTLACFSFQYALPMFRDLHLQYLLSRITSYCDRVREHFQVAEYMSKHPLQNKG